MSDSNEQATDVPLHERMYCFAFKARRLGTKATGPGEHHVCTPVFDDGHGFAMFSISMFEEAAVLLERHSQRAPAPSESPQRATITDEMVEAASSAYCDEWLQLTGKWAGLHPLKQRQMREWMRAALEAAVGPALARLAELECDTWYRANDIDRMVRELDVAINGEEGAAPQAMLCDVTAQLMNKTLPRLRKLEAMEQRAKIAVGQYGLISRSEEFRRLRDLAKHILTGSDAKKVGE